MATGDTGSETREFQAEVKQLLKLVIHSLYSNRDIFLRELISNASDACDRLRFEALTQEELSPLVSDLHIRVDHDAEARTVTVSDNGAGMTRDDVIANIGTIAKSGTRQFLDQLSGDQQKDAQLIGQFGVGFYAAFVVAERVELITRRAGEPEDAAVRWASAGDGSYTLDAATRTEPGTDVILHLSEDCEEFADRQRLQQIINHYSDHITFPIRMPAVDDEGNRKDDELETVNRASALWKRPKKDISTEEYAEFYKHIAHDFEDPLLWTHSHVEGKYEYTTLFYIPRRAPFDLFDRDRGMHGVKLYVQRVFIMDEADKLLPRYLRFVRGLVDSNDLPLNVSREILQSNKVVDSIRNASVKKILDLLEDTANKDPETYATFWREFGQVLKEGAVEDFANRERILGLLRFVSTHAEADGEQTVSLADYISRMGEGQEKIWYVTADSLKAAQKSPHLEVFRKQGIEVLLLHDRVDEWLMAQVAEYQGYKFASVAKGEIDLGEDAEQEDTKGGDDLAARIRAVLDERVADVRVSRRLTDSPACLVLGDFDVALHMQHLLRQAGHHVPESRPTLEINPAHPLLQRMAALGDDDRFSDWSEVLFDQAVLAEGGQLNDPAAFVSRLNGLLASWPSESPAADSSAAAEGTAESGVTASDPAADTATDSADGASTGDDAAAAEPESEDRPS